MIWAASWQCAQRRHISLGGCPGWSESSLCAQWEDKDPSFLHADSEDSDQIGRMPRLISLRWVHTHFVGFVMRRLNDASMISLFICLKHSRWAFETSGKHLFCTEKKCLATRARCPSILSSIAIELNVPRGESSSIAIEQTFGTLRRTFKKPIQSSLISVSKGALSVNC